MQYVTFQTIYKYFFQDSHNLSALQPYFPWNPNALVSRKLPPESAKKRRQIASWHRLWLELGRYLIAFEPLTFVLD